MESRRCLRRALKCQRSSRHPGATWRLGTDSQHYPARGSPAPPVVGGGVLMLTVHQTPAASTRGSNLMPFQPQAGGCLAARDTRPPTGDPYAP